MTASSTAAPAPERAAAPDRPARGLDARLAAVSARMDARLAEAGLAVDVSAILRGLDVEPVDLADVVRLPDAVEPYRPTATPYETPAAALLQRTRERLERGGWCQGAMTDEDGRRCLYGAMRAEATGPAELGDALAVLLEAIRRAFPDAESVPSFNDRHGPRAVFRVLDQAADLAHARNL
ncbi:hypothetical protein SUDANB58_05763 (plasmid) [Streptomyces sp. enrichment culture]|uniref:DUF6197 family protein n=1 Tax=Streptomyces sp. enrichment culture TaxID=1795815 RepID=UPI003F57DD3E